MHSMHVWGVGCNMRLMGAVMSVQCACQSMGAVASVQPDSGLLQAQIGGWGTMHSRMGCGMGFGDEQEPARTLPGWIGECYSINRRPGLHGSRGDQRARCKIMSQTAWALGQALRHKPYMLQTRFRHTTRKKAGTLPRLRLTHQ